MAIERLVITASIKQWTIAPFSSNSTSVTEKCFSLEAGFTAVHLLFSNFFGFKVFIRCGSRVTGDWVCSLPWYWLAIPVNKMTALFCFCVTYHLQNTLGTLRRCIELAGSDVGLKRL